MPTERFPHLFLEGPSASPDFTRTDGGGDSKHALPARDPQAHARKLESHFDHAWQEAEGRQAVVRSTRDGCYIEFVSSPGSRLPERSLEDIAKGIRIRSVRPPTETRDGAVEKKVCVYVPKDARNAFLRKLHAYRDSSQQPKPTNSRLISQVESIAAAVLQDFWTDTLKSLPKDRPEWVEVWLATDEESELAEFRRLLAEAEIREHAERPLLRFPERSIILVLATGAQLARLIDLSDLIAEFRSAREVPTFFYELENRDQARLCQDLLDRVEEPGPDAPAVCILDHGVNRGHPLIAPLLAEADLHTFDAAWGTADDHGHGTLMAGLAAYGDLQEALESNRTVTLTHCLESSKILPPPHLEGNPRHLWGVVTSQGISRAEITAGQRKRAVCLAVTATETANAGQPSSWSAELDALAAGTDGIRRRLILVSSGNAAEMKPDDYPAANLTDEIHDPAQAWNAITVGACTFKTRITSSSYDGHHPLAAAGGLSPFSTTSSAWDSTRWPIKPEIVLEGGNLARSQDDRTTDPEDLKLLSTHRDPTVAHFWPFDATSAATAQAAWMAAKIQAAYPEAWPETIRALLVHSASWTDEMRRQFLHGTDRRDYRTMLRACGYGIPDLDRAISCLRSSLTLVVEQEIPPFIHEPGKDPRTHQMHLYRLPWPKEELLKLGEIEVSMRVTLSYFVEPSPGEVGWDARYRYPSHGLRFQLNSPGESEDEFSRRINKKARTDERDKPTTKSPTDYWTFGEQRDTGSLHHDIWTGRATDLADSNLIAVCPVGGWWKDRPHLRRSHSRSRYALVVSIETPAEMTDIYTPIAKHLGVQTPTPIAIPV